MDRRVRERSAEDRRSQGRISAGFQPSTSSSKRPYGEVTLTYGQSSGSGMFISASKLLSTGILIEIFFLSSHEI
jgi:hypothetical protein